MENEKEESELKEKSGLGEEPELKEKSGLEEEPELKEKSGLEEELENERTEGAEIVEAEWSEYFNGLNGTAEYEQ